MQRTDSSRTILASLLEHPTSRVLVVSPEYSDLLYQIRRTPMRWPDFSAEAEANDAHRHGRSIPQLERLTRPPVRLPHYTTSMRGLVGAYVCHSSKHEIGEHEPCSSHPQEVVWHPGEFALAHGGLLALAELQSWSLAALSALSDAARSGEIRLREPALRQWVSNPTRFRVVMLADPCACRRPGGVCRCTPDDRRRHVQRIADFAQLAEEQFAYRCDPPDLPAPSFRI